MSSVAGEVPVSLKVLPQTAVPWRVAAACRGRWARRPAAASARPRRARAAAVPRARALVQHARRPTQMMRRLGNASIPYKMTDQV